MCNFLSCIAFSFGWTSFAVSVKPRSAAVAEASRVIELGELPFQCHRKPHSHQRQRHQRADSADAYSIELPAGASTDPEILARFIFAHQAPWIRTLISVRDGLVGGLGLKSAKHLTSLGASSGAGRLSIFKIYSTSPTEVVLGEDDKHLDFRLSVLCSVPAPPRATRHLVLSTVVHCHNRLGRLYIFLIAPFHRLVVRSSLRSAARIGWPSATQA